MAISLQRLTIYLYSAHRAVIFAIAQISCLMHYLPISQCKHITNILIIRVLDAR